MEEYGLEDWEDINEDPAQFAERARAVLGSSYLSRLSADKQAMMREALAPADTSDMIYDDLGGEALDIFDRAEASLHL